MSDKARILIVDHDEYALISLERVLEEAGYGTATAWGREEALRVSGRTLFDLLLIDEHLGDLDSATLVGELKLLQPTAALLLMRTRKGRSEELSGLASATVCKWEHNEVKDRVNSFLAA